MENRRTSLETIGKTVSQEPKFSQEEEGRVRSMREEKQRVVQPGDTHFQAAVTKWVDE